ncbi:bifunctional 4-hydroxy-2-oxoglutarate aldolase/2-dehydro-3-deoxy-phosphogluconate aldolase [Haloferax marisrubri]|uniref:2-dehydro-3-deoxyphosphogluconate aldolase n=1 Tax=Haloferax marisrubri TaxID=1544719 RepID=A0A2P4NMF7_9EURY|nr:2-dehydro-3-deoxyphosphogluconate aldolase [Haloferax marisrubri]
MGRKQSVQQQLIDSGIVSVLRGISEQKIVDVTTAIYEGGVTALEITADNSDFAAMISVVEKELRETDAVVGAGTVMDAATAHTAIDAGASFVVAPNFNAEVIDVCNDKDVVAIPGVMTPTEVVKAMNAGADILKMFPAATVGPSHMSALRGPLGEVPIMATGGVSADNVDSYFDAGAVAVGAGSALVNHEAIENDEMDGVRSQAEKFVSAVESARSK